MHSVREAMQSVLSWFCPKARGRTKPRLAVHQHESETLGEEGKRNCNGYSCRGQATRTSYGSYGGGSLQPSVWSYYILTDGKE